MILICFQIHKIPQSAPNPFLSVFTKLFFPCHLKILILSSEIPNINHSRETCLISSTWSAEYFLFPLSVFHHHVILLLFISNTAENTSFPNITVQNRRQVLLIQYTEKLPTWKIKIKMSPPLVRYDKHDQKYVHGLTDYVKYQFQIFKKYNYGCKNDT